ncbi:hypothetical protein D515_02376 [Grimontia indica]|uniref:Uncharacterized protein n=1 Tax=Grimontia indica TaxID=1056512 RepID=R1GS10_9GAMM|nr:hypothetical protein D515_02376 [Grimontia indica]
MFLSLLNTDFTVSEEWYFCSAALTLKHNRVNANDMTNLVFIFPWPSKTNS